MFITNKLPSFMRIKTLQQLYMDGKMHIIYHQDKIVGFYTLDNHMFQNLYIKPYYRRQGFALRSIQMEMQRQRITIATTRRSCPIKRLIQKLGFINTHKIVQGKQSLLEIWESVQGG